MFRQNESDLLGLFSMRRNPKPVNINSTHEPHNGLEFDAMRLMCDLEARMAKLEKAFEGSGFLLAQVLPDIPAEAPKRPGPKPVPIWSLIPERDSLVEMLEAYWPELEFLCRPSPNEQELESALHAIAKAQAGHYSHPAKKLIGHLPELVDFLSSDRFRGNPRQIANAFAGFPKIGIWRSLKQCQSRPCNRPIGQRAIKSYISRKHPNLYRELIADYSLPNFARALRAYRSQDRKLDPFRADYLYLCWQSCKPNNFALGASAIELH